MAVAVDISGSKYLSFSPLHEKHNILYKSARQSFNQRYKQKPWFRLNPFTDRGVGKGENIEKHDPETDVGISQLQSLVIVEDYFNETPQFIQEFNISEFWDFLFSDSWSNGYSVRVFEGQLLEMMSTCLFTLIQSNKVVKHVTKAYAKNIRQKYSIVKIAEQKEPELISFVETLLLKFVYYGHVVQPAYFDTVSSFGYPEVTTTTTTTETDFREMLDQGPLITDVTSSSNSLLDMKSPSAPSAGLPQNIQHPRKKRVRASAVVAKQIEKERSMITSYVSHNESILPIPPMIPRGKNYRYTCSNYSNASDDYKSLPPKVDLNNFICTEKVPYLGEFNLPDDGSSSSSSEDEDDDDDSEDFGQNFYLGNSDQTARENVYEAAKSKLKRRKEVIQTMREQRKEELAILKMPKAKILPEFSELDVKKYVEDHEVKKVIDVPEGGDVPTLEGYAASLEADQKREARLRLKKMGSKMFQKPPVIMAKLGYGVPLGGKLKPPFNWNFTTPAQRIALLEKKFNLKVKKKPQIVKRTNIIVVPLVYLSMPSGRSILHPISKELYEKKKEESEEQIRQTSMMNSTKRRTSLLPTTGTALNYELLRAKRETKGRAPDKPKFQRVKLFSSDESIESLDDDSDNESDDLDISKFDSKKLNIKYSINRIRKAAAEKKAEQKKKSRYYSVLKKYCRVQTMMNALGGSSNKQRRSSVGGFTSRFKKMKAMGAKNTPKKDDAVRTIQNADVGKLKKFAFLEAKVKDTVPSVLPLESLFQSYPMELFQENLERALKEFVVRQEMIVSDFNGKTLVSFTFTKKSVFTLSK